MNKGKESRFVITYVEISLYAGAIKYEAINNLYDFI